MRIVFDWDGTIAKRTVANEAAHRRLLQLGKTVDKEWLDQAQRNHDHYKLNKELITKNTGITEEPDLTIIMTSLFTYHYLSVAHELGDELFYEDIVSVLKQLKEQGHELLIVSTLREDIIRPVVKQRGIADLFSDIKANTADLEFSKEELVQKVIDAGGDIHCIIGDRNEDIDAAHSHNAKAIATKWGHGTDDAYDAADFVIEKPQEILEIISSL